MFVREKKNKSGTVSVQIIDKSSGSYRVAKTVGSSSDPEEIAFDYTKSVLGGKISVVFYDMTILYFEAADEDDLRITGFSKDGKPQNPQILLGLLLMRVCYPHRTSRILDPSNMNLLLEPG